MANYRVLRLLAKLEIPLLLAVPAVMAAALLAGIEQAALAMLVVVALVLALFSALWAVPLAAVAYGAVYAVSLVLPNSLGLFLSWEIVIVAVFLYACMVVRYQCAYTLLAERKDLGCWRAVRMAAETFRAFAERMYPLLDGQKQPTAHPVPLKNLWQTVN